MTQMNTPAAPGTDIRCPGFACGRKVRILRNGTIGSHTNGINHCAGSRRTPAEAAQAAAAKRAAIGGTTLNR